MIQIDGSIHSGSGTLLRYAATLATLTSEPLHMVRIRAKREKPGLRPQHLQALRACCELSSGRLEGDFVGSEEIFYYPGEGIKSGDFQWDIGTAGSTTMLAFTLIPAALFSKGSCRFSMSGGLFQDYAPSAFHMQHVLLPIVQKMGGDIRLEVRRPGYVPQGQGSLRVDVEPLKRPLHPLHMTERGSIAAIHGIALASHLEREKVSERMANRCRELLESRGYKPRIDVFHDTTAVQKGAALLLYAETSTGCRLGADRAGRPGRRSESIAEFVVTSLLEDMGTGATTDRHLADQLILFAALADGKTEYTIPQSTDHVASNLWLVNKMLGANVELTGNWIRIDGIGFLTS